jgi:hypothetical protein
MYLEDATRDKLQQLVAQAELTGRSAERARVAAALLKLRTYTSGGGGPAGAMVLVRDLLAVLDVEFADEEAAARDRIQGLVARVIAHREDDPNCLCLAHREDDLDCLCPDCMAETARIADGMKLCE